MVRFPGNILEAGLIFALWYYGMLKKKSVKQIAGETGICIAGYLAALVAELFLVSLFYGSFAGYDCGSDRDIRECLRLYAGGNAVVYIKRIRTWDAVDALYVFVCVAGCSVYGDPGRKISAAAESCLLPVHPGAVFCTWKVGHV